MCVRVCARAQVSSPTPFFHCPVRVQPMAGPRSLLLPPSHTPSHVPLFAANIRPGRKALLDSRGAAAGGPSAAASWLPAPLLAAAAAMPSPYENHHTLAVLHPPPPPPPPLPPLTSKDAGAQPLLLVLLPLEVPLCVRVGSAERSGGKQPGLVQVEGAVQTDPCRCQMALALQPFA